MKGNIILLLLLLGVFAQDTLQAQEKWSLEKCISYANEENISLKQAELGIENARLSRQQSQMARLPGLNLSGSAGIQFGRTIDPTTNTFDNQTIGFNSFSLNTGITVFAGGQINNSIRQSKIEVDIAQLGAQESANNLMLEIARIYLNILLAEDQLVNARNRKTLSEAQLEQVDQLIRAGSLPENDRLNILTQVAIDEQAIIQADNLVQQGYLQLKNLLQIEPGREIAVVRPEIPDPQPASPESLRFATVYNAALQTQPQVKAAELQIRSADLDVDLAEAALYPTLSLFAGIDTRWSSVGQVFTGTTTQRLPVTAYLDNDPILLELDFPTSNFEEASYWDQVNENFGQSVGVSLSVPIYTNNRNRVALQRARLGVLNSRYNQEQVKQRLENDVQTAVANARAAEQNFAAARRSFEAADAAYQNARKRYDLGAINTFEFTTARTNRDTAETELVRAKYESIFRQKIVDFYLGKELRLN